MTRNEYLEWIQTVSQTLAERKYPHDPNLQRIWQLGLVQRALADLCYHDSDNTRLVNTMLKRNLAGPTRQFKHRP